MPEPGDVVVCEFAGAVATKRRPLVVVSSDIYHKTRPDVVVAVLTTQVHTSVGPTDYLLQDWASAGLHAPSAFRAYFGMQPAAGLRVIGRLSKRDWEAVQNRLGIAIAIGP